ncbi:efflux RND transporter periplasmic adaptor subunit [Aurantimonas sp. A2-1-M11]|uniref:efflux RND transporter periplasmic adaptor subunit n=1 Tax=Aurantimonas sp. A2-1-M11 TaxID=3113712 RepID=UPI002F93B146
MGFLKQILVTILVLVVAGAGYIKFDPSAGRALLDSDLPLPDQMRSAILWISPEAGEPAAEVASGESGPGRRRGGGGTMVVTAPVTTGSTRTQMRSIGSGEAARSVVVHPDNTTGIIEEVAVQSADVVEEGTVLVRLERASEELAVDRARIALDAAEDKVARFERLRQANTLSAVEVNDVMRERDNARLDLRAAEIALGKRDIRAPIPGRVGIIAVDRGDLVSTDTVIATVDDREHLKVIFYTPESFVQQLAIGTRVEAVSTAQPDTVYDGEITAIDSRLDEASRTLRTEALIDNSADQLRPGMSFSVSLSLEGETFLSVDPISVVWERTGPIVWKVVDGKAVKAPVRIIERTIDRVLVASTDLAVGDTVVVEGLQSVREGGPVEILNGGPEIADPAPAEPTPSASTAPAASGGDSRATAESLVGITRAEAAEQPRTGQDASAGAARR